jgi:integrase
MKKDIGPVFIYKGSLIRDLHSAFYRAYAEAEIEEFRFHDLRHCFVTNQRRKGVPDRVTMSITGHLTMECFKRYDTISVDDLKRAVQG